MFGSLICMEGVQASNVQCIVTGIFLCYLLLSNHAIVLVQLTVAAELGEAVQSRFTSRFIPDS